MYLKIPFSETFLFKEVFLENPSFPWKFQEESISRNKNVTKFNYGPRFYYDNIHVRIYTHNEVGVT